VRPLARFGSLFGPKSEEMRSKIPPKIDRGKASKITPKGSQKGAKTDAKTHQKTMPKLVSKKIRKIRKIHVFPKG
jgi:hypothetical protein